MVKKMRKNRDKRQLIRMGLVKKMDTDSFKELKRLKSLIKSIESMDGSTPLI
jgi:hypothetical protein